MKKLSSIILVLFLGIIFLDSCKKTTDVVTPAIPVVVGTWKLDRVIVSQLPAPYTNGNGKNLDPLQYFGIQSVYNLIADNTFTNRETLSGVITDSKGTWTYTTNQLSLKFSDNSTDSYTYDDATKVLNSDLFASALFLTNPNTQKVDSVACKFQVVYVKQ
jgi:Lipocalin-like domain